MFDDFEWRKEYDSEEFGYVHRAHSQDGAVKASVQVSCFYTPGVVLYTNVSVWVVHEGTRRPLETSFCIDGDDINGGKEAAEKAARELAQLLDVWETIRQ